MPTSVTGERSPFEIGFMTFAEITADPDTGTLPSAHPRAQETIERARLADEVGLDLFAVGERHRTDFVGSAPSVVLAAAAQATTNIRLMTLPVAVFASSGDFDGTTLLTPRVYGRIEMVVEDVSELALVATRGRPSV
ncbi:MAG: LLM class flavin-dependent oxidoreductase [Candidatus Limnocylindria bacterium]